MIRNLKPLKVLKTLQNQNLLVFSPYEFMRAFGVSLDAARQFLKNHSKDESGLFMKVKNGMYALRAHLPPAYLLANKMLVPSYVSLETALSHYSIIPEIVYTITSVTTKLRREFTTPWLAFSYQQIKRHAFTGYTQHKEDGIVTLVAEPEKALVDYLYFADLGKREPNDRLNLSKLSREKVEDYARLFGRKSLFRLIENVYADQEKPRRIY